LLKPEKLDEAVAACRKSLELNSAVLRLTIMLRSVLAERNLGTTVFNASRKRPRST